MSLDEAIKIYNEFISSEEMKKFKEAENMIMDEINSQKPIEEYYKSSKKYDYYIQLPYDEVILTSDGAIFRHNGYNGIAKQKEIHHTIIVKIYVCRYTMSQKKI